MRIMPPVMNQREPMRSVMRPAIGAMRMMSTVMGRNAAPACTAE